ncbi:MAG TPA: hypothetical protein VJ932_04495, partial [Alkalispirochaeta sp.]|nr:hypothetical protein [Alkalispirochaeta sp.]
DGRVTPLAVAAVSAALINVTLRGAFGWEAGAAFPVAMVVGALIAMVPAGQTRTAEATPVTEEDADGSP